jgi:hypothetical protein
MRVGEVHYAQLFSRTHPLPQVVLTKPPTRYRVVVLTSWAAPIAIRMGNLYQYGLARLQFVHRL